MKSRTHVLTGNKKPKCITNRVPGYHQLMCNEFLYFTCVLFDWLVGCFED